MRATLRQRGLTLIELIVFIVIVSVALVGVLSVFNVTIRSSADPMIRKQMLAIAEALLEEVQLQPFTFCDPTDDNAAMAESPELDPSPPYDDPIRCWRRVEGLGATGEQWDGTTLDNQSRTSTTAPFNNVSDYVNANGTAISGDTHGLGDASNAIENINGNPAAPLGYTATITVVPENLGPTGTPIVASNCWTSTSCSVRITVTVTHGSESIVLEGYRARYAPNFLP